MFALLRIDKHNIRKPLPYFFSFDIYFVQQFALVTKKLFFSFFIRRSQKNRRDGDREAVTKRKEGGTICVERLRSIDHSDFSVANNYVKRVRGISVFAERRLSLSDKNGAIKARDKWFTSSCVWHFLKRNQPSAYFTVNNIKATYVGLGDSPRKQEHRNKICESLAKLLQVRFIRQIF